jgi:predicted nuclease of restriction endonuclease-like (RecB) superfamily
MSNNNYLNSSDYITLLDNIKMDVQTSRIRAHLSVNKELIMLYWRIGKQILDIQETNGWGSKVIDTLSQDLLAVFPDIRGLSPQES